MSKDLSSRQMLIDAMASQQPVLLSGAALSITFQTYIKSMTSSQVVLENRIRPEYIRRFLASDHYMLQTQMVRFKASSLDSDGQDLLFPLEEGALISETRQSERYAFAPEERVIAEILNPFDMETRVTKAVMDMSSNGLSLRTNALSKLFAPKVRLPSIKIVIDGILNKDVAGEVVYRREFVDIRGKLKVQVGIKFDA